jgi:23S rRNA pseudouridine2605 synthase
MPIGRLDFNTEGLLLLTNAGGFKREMELPATGVPRTYRARTYGDISQGQLEDLMDGITIEGIRYGPIDANMERRTGRNQWIELTLTEGKNREVRRVLEQLGLEVSRLIRTAYGPFALADLAKGQAVEVRKEELERFRSALKGGSPRRAGDRPAPRPPAQPREIEPVAGGKGPRAPRRAPRGNAADEARSRRRGAPGGPKTGGRHPSPPQRGPKK